MRVDFTISEESRLHRFDFDGFFDVVFLDELNLEVALRRFVDDAIHHILILSRENRDGEAGIGDDDHLIVLNRIDIGTFKKGIVNELVVHLRFDFQEDAIPERRDFTNGVFHKNYR